MADSGELLADAASRQAGNEMELTVRDLLIHWNAKRRGVWIVQQIERDLAAAGLTTIPSFTDVWIDDSVLLAQAGSEVAIEAVADLEEVIEATGDVGAPVSLRIGSLPSANEGVIHVSPSDSLEKAQSLMLMNDFSQLAVLDDPRYLRGAVSWESIAHARIIDPEAPLKDAIIHADAVRADDDLLTMIPRIKDAGFVFVLARDRQINGIITTADLSEQFAILANPFFMLAEIERRLRRIISKVFTTDDFSDIVDPDNVGRPPKSADDLTFGGYKQLFENRERWKRLGWALDRKVFVGALDATRVTRNEVMHFSPDPLDQDQLDGLIRFLKWLRMMDHEV